MKVWVALGGWDYEGWDRPVGVFTSKILAEQALARSTTGYNDTSIFEYEVDSLEDKP